MAIAWSRISSKVIVHPPYAEAACSRRCAHRQSRSDVCIPHMVDRRKQEVLGVRDAAVTPLSQTRGGYVSRALGQTVIATDPHGIRTIVQHACPCEWWFKANRKILAIYSCK